MEVMCGGQTENKLPWGFLHLLKPVNSRTCAWGQWELVSFHTNTLVFIHDTDGDSGHTEEITPRGRQVKIDKKHKQSPASLNPLIHLHCLDLSGRWQQYKWHQKVICSIMEKMHPELQQRWIKYIPFPGVFQQQTRFIKDYRAVKWVVKLLSYNTSWAIKRFDGGKWWNYGTNTQKNYKLCLICVKVSSYIYKTQTVDVIGFIQN